MSTEADPDLMRLVRAIDATRRPVQALHDEDLAKPTPCSEWDVRAVLNHMVAGNLAAAARLSGSSLTNPSIDFLGEDFRRAFDESSRKATEAFGQEGALDTEIEHPLFGRTSGRLLIQVRTADLLAHGWDIAAATGQDLEGGDDGLYDETLEAAGPFLSRVERGSGKAFGPPTDPPQNSSAADRFAAMLGRSVPGKPSAA
jgi:uncharacterized protein (TIGR03086 family)